MRLKINKIYKYKNPDPGRKHYFTYIFKGTRGKNARIIVIESNLGYQNLNKIRLTNKIGLVRHSTIVFNLIKYLI